MVRNFSYHMDLVWAVSIYNYSLCVFEYIDRPVALCRVLLNEVKVSSGRDVTADVLILNLYKVTHIRRLQGLWFCGGSLSGSCPYTSPPALPFPILEPSRISLETQLFTWVDFPSPDVYTSLCPNTRISADNGWSRWNNLFHVMFETFWWTYLSWLLKHIYRTKNEANGLVDHIFLTLG